MYCEKCGKTVDGKRCSACGCKTVDETVNSDAHARFLAYMEKNRPSARKADSVPKKPKPKKNKKKKKGRLVGGVAAAVLLIVVGVVGICEYPAILRFLSPEGYVEYANNITSETLERELSGLKLALGSETVGSIKSGIYRRTFGLGFDEVSTGSAYVNELMPKIKFELDAVRDNTAKRAYVSGSFDYCESAQPCRAYIDEDRAVLDFPWAIKTAVIEESGLTDEWNTSSWADIFGEIDPNSAFDFADFFENGEAEAEPAEDDFLNKCAELQSMFKESRTVENAGKQSVKALGGEYYDIVFTADAKPLNGKITDVLKQLYDEKIPESIKGPEDGIYPDGIYREPLLTEPVEFEADTVEVHFYIDDRNRCVGYMFEGKAEGKANAAAKVGLYFRPAENLIDDIFIEVYSDGKKIFIIDSKGNHVMDGGVFSDETSLAFVRGDDEEKIDISVRLDGNQPENNLTLAIKGEHQRYINFTGTYLIQREVNAVSLSLNRMYGMGYNEEFDYKLSLDYILSPAAREDIQLISSDGARDFLQPEVNRELADAVAQIIRSNSDNGYSYDPDVHKRLEEEYGFNGSRQPESAEKLIFDICETDEDIWADITGYNGDAEILIIPDEIDGKPVRGIAENAFSDNKALKALRLPDSLTEIRDGAFINCENLEFVLCGSGLQEIGEDAFFHCTSLKEVKLNEGLRKIRPFAFSFCSSLKGVYIPESVDELSTLAFLDTPWGFVITGNAGSRAQACATENNYKFKTMG